MIEKTVRLDDVRTDGTARLPLGPGRDAPMALLSLRARGSMVFRHGEQNPCREEFFRSLGVEPDRVLAVELIHSRTVLFPSGRDELRGKQADGIIVKEGPWVPTVTVADCMPIWIRHEASGAYGVLHSGWQGTGILQAAVEGLVERYGATPSEIDVILGPSIGPCCYKVPEERADIFRERFGEESVCFKDGSWRLDLAAANLGLARGLGLRSLTRLSACTFCEEDLGSYRREGPQGFTRMVAAALSPMAGTDAS
jgi:polyphenol oxidase